MICTADTSSIACHDCVHVHVLLHVYSCTMNIMSLLFSCQKQGGPVQLSMPPEPCNQSVSFQAGVSKSNMSSFSVHEDSLAEQSSFVPSWPNMSRDAATHRRTSEPIADKLSTCSNAGATGPRAPSSWPGEALGVPLEGDGGGGGGGGGGEVSVVEQSFTQICSRHPKIAPSISTPVDKNMKGLHQNACTCVYMFCHVL